MRNVPYCDKDNELIIKLIFLQPKKRVAKIVYVIYNQHYQYYDRSILNQGEHYNEKELLQSVAEGNETAFAKLFHIWYPRLMAYIFKVARSQQVSEEIVQDIFTKIWENRSELNTINNFQGYLFTLSRNHALNELQRIAVYWKIQRRFADQQTAEDSILPDEESVEDIMENVLNQLTPRQREIWLLNRRHCYTYNEISLRLGISRETVKTHLQAATQSLTALLNSRSLLFIALAGGI